MRRRNFCGHGQRKERCAECGGAELCAHGRRREQCAECQSFACDLCLGRKFSRAATLLAHMRLYHGAERGARTKRAELEVYQWLLEDGVPFRYQAHVPFHACGLRGETCRAFVDFLVDTYWGAVILEVDEGAHKSQDPSCDVRRDFDLVASTALGSGGSIVVVRYSPDDFSVAGERVRVSKRNRRAQLLGLLDRLREEEPEQPFQRLFLYYDVDGPVSTLPSVARHWEPAAWRVSRVYNDCDVLGSSSDESTPSTFSEPIRKMELADVNVMAVSFEPSRGKAKPGMKFWTATPPQSFVLDAVVPWPASAFDGDGTEKHLSLCFRVGNEDCARIKELEHRAAQVSDKELHSCLRDNVLKTKIHLEGDRCVAFWGVNKERIDEDAAADVARTIRERRVKALVTVRGVYQSGRSCGLMLETTDVLLGEPEERTCPF
jgi:hypothetical protein